MNVVLLHKTFHKRFLEHAQIGRAQLEDLRCPLAGNEEGGFGVFVGERLALVHCPLCAGILGLPACAVSPALLLYPTRKPSTHTCRNMLALFEGKSRNRNLGAWELFLSVGVGGRWLRPKDLIRVLRRCERFSAPVEGHEYEHVRGQSNQLIRSSRILTPSVHHNLCPPRKSSSHFPVLTTVSTNPRPCSDSALQRCRETHPPPWRRFRK